MKKCSNAKKYKGIYPPACNKGAGCDACREIYEKRQAALDAEPAMGIDMGIDVGSHHAIIAPCWHTMDPRGPVRWVTKKMETGPEGMRLQQQQFCMTCGYSEWVDVPVVAEGEEDNG